MADQIELMQKNIIPPLYALEGAPLETFSVAYYVENPNQIPLTFSAQLSDGKTLPAGLEMSKTGYFGGTPAKGTARKEPYIVVFVASAEKTAPLILSAPLKIYKPEEYEGEITEEINQLTKSKALDIQSKLAAYWKNFADKLPLPNMEELANRKVTPMEVYYLLQRFATLTIWNGDDLSAADKGKLIEVKGISPRYKIYDFGVALVATPKDLYDSNRTLTDSIKTAKALVHEAIEQRGWNIELAGLDKMVTAAWIEVQAINRLAKKEAKIYNYQPTYADYDVLKLAG